MRKADIRRVALQYSRSLAAYARISSTDCTSLSDGACRTIIREPTWYQCRLASRLTIQLKHPQTPSRPSFSSRKKDARIAPTITLIAPRGVTRMAGAKVYAAKFATTSQHDTQTTVSEHMQAAASPADHSAPQLLTFTDHHCRLAPLMDPL